MEPNDRVDRIFPGAYCLKPDDLKSFEALLRGESGKVRCVLETALRRTEHGSVDALLADPFLNSSRIQFISLDSRPAGVDVTVEFRRSFWRPVSFRLRGPQNAVIPLEMKLESLIQKPRKWFSALIAPFGQHLVAGLFVNCVAMAALGVVAWRASIEFSGGTISPALSTMATASSVILLLCWLWLLLPCMVFAIGKGQRQAEAIQALVSWVFTGVCTAAAVNWLTSIWNPLQP